MATVELPLTQGKVTLIDEDELPLLDGYTWRAQFIRNIWYAVTRVNGRTVYLHRLLEGNPCGMEVDHINGDGLDNRKTNRRICTHQENMRNVRRTTPPRSGFRGVYATSSGKFAARIKLNRKELYLGQYTTAEEADRVRDHHAKRIHGEFAYLNFPEDF